MKFLKELAKTEIKFMGIIAIFFFFESLIFEMLGV